MTVINDNDTDKLDEVTQEQEEAEMDPHLGNIELEAATADEKDTKEGISPEKCTIEVFSSDIVDRPPPDYSLTSPCLPPSSPREQDWPPEPPPPFDGYPPYPAGPPLLKIAYPKDIPGPTYACPKCEGRFLYHRPAGIVQCPFCHTAISIGRYVRIRACSMTMFGLLFLLSSLAFALTNMIFLNCSRPYFFAVGMMALFALVLLFCAVRMHSRYRETDRIEFT